MSIFLPKTTVNGIENLVEDTTPQLGGTLDANGYTIDMGTYVITDAKVGQWDTAYGWGNHASAGYLTTVTEAHIETALSTATAFSARNYVLNVDQTVGVGQDNYVLTYDHATGEIGLEAAAGGGASQLSDLSDVSTSTPTNRNVLVANGTVWVSRALVELDISDLGSYLANVSEDSSPTLGGTLDANGNDITNVDSLYLSEQAAAEADTAGKGQFWVRSDAPNTPMFTDDTGVDHELLAPDVDHIYANPNTLADHEAAGVFVTLSTAEASTFGQVCFINNSGAAALADANAAGESPAVALSLGRSHPSAGPFLTHGVAEDASWSWTAGGKIYLSTTPGAMTQTAPSATGDIVQVLGVALSATHIFFNPSLDTLTHA